MKIDLLYKASQFWYIACPLQFEFTMKTYLSEYNHALNLNLCGKSEGERSRSKLGRPACIKVRVESSKTIHETHNNQHSSTTSRNKESNRTENLNSHPISVRLQKPQHQRNHTDTGFEAKAVENKAELQGLNKTHSKNRLKTEISNYNGETIKVVKRQQNKLMELQDDAVWGMVRERLHNDKKSKKATSTHSSALKQLNQMIQKAKDIAVKSSVQEAYNSDEISTKAETEPSQKRMSELIARQIDEVHAEIKKEGKPREQELCESLRSMWGLVKLTAAGEKEMNQGRLLIKLRELQDRNVRLMSLVNQLKRRGIDVDSFWNQCNKTI